MKYAALILAASMALVSLAGCSPRKGAPDESAQIVEAPVGGSLSQPTDTPAAYAYRSTDQSVGEAEDALFFNPPGDSLRKPSIAIYKSIRRLELLDGDVVVGRFRIALGVSDIGDKEREGDGKTPEGTFYVCMRNENSRFHKSLGVSYPSIEDAERGKAAGIIDEATRLAIMRAIESGDRPLWDSALGGEICIHGGGTASDWTLGCIALDDSDMDLLFACCPLGTPVEIYP